jgi:hypothetical protein
MTDILLKNATEKEMLEEVMKRRGIQITEGEYQYKLVLVDKKTLTSLKTNGQLKVRYDEQK